MYADLYVSKVHTQKHIYRSIIASLIFHSLLYVFYFNLRDISKENMILLEDIEIIEIEPDAPMPQDEVMPAQAPPKNVLDFLKMAFIPAKEQDFKEVSEPEVEDKYKVDTTQKIDLGKKLDFSSKQKVSLDRKIEYTENTQLSEFASDLDSARTERIDMMAPQDPAIDIAEVGKVGFARPPSSQPINLAKKTRVSTPKDLKEFNTVQPNVSRQSGGFKEASISIDKKRASKSSAGYTKGVSIGYSKGVKFKKYKRKSTQDLSDISVGTGKEEKTSAGMVREATASKKAVEIMGPVTKRGIVKSYLPVYPDWARAQHVEADVSIRFYVSPDGRVRDKAYIERTSGYSKLDRLAMEAIKKWLFAPIDKSKGDQWGVVTFKYVLR